MNVGVVVDRKQIRRTIQPAPYQCPGRQDPMMIIDDIDVLAANDVVAEQICQGHEIALRAFLICQQDNTPPIARESTLFVRLGQN